MLTQFFSQFVQSSRWLSIAMLAFLHAAFWMGIDSAWARPLLLAHLGLFMLWQPLWRSEARLSWGNSALILPLSLSALLWLNWWVLAFWVSGLFALVGGRVFTFHSRWQRAFYLFLMTYLLAVLLLYIAPHLFGLPDFHEVTNNLLNFGLPFLLLIMAVLPIERDASDNVQAVDFIYVLLLFTLLILLILGSLAFMTLGRVEYLVALLRTLFLLGAALMVLGVLWSPRLGFSGLQASFSRYVLSIGTPLEEWLKQIALAAQQEQNPATFLEHATNYLIEMPSISGISWWCAEGHGDSGVSSHYRVELEEGDLVLTLFTHKSVSPTVLLHMKLLVQVLGHFYQAKRREQRLREMTRQQTIYETGARLTHDLKNMLQSLFALTSVAQHDSAKAQPILKNQLPVLTQRIESLLAKLKAPGEDEEEIKMPLSTWWESVKQRNQHRDIEWVTGDGKTSPHPNPLPEGKGIRAVGATSSPSPYGRGVGVRETSSKPSPIHANTQLIPAPMFDCVLDNLLENASNKRLRESGIRIEVRLTAEPLGLEVRDTGSAVPKGIARNLLRTVVPSEDGLGVGMYQAARWAQQMGYRLTLKENREGAVRFELKPA
ncbi:MAG: ATP-binding region ATPase domain protein [Gallionellaceae bacterium]|nr:MAG: ATP-binding region ATPase domain protein [Gallionellaceae bacterium]